MGLKKMHLCRRLWIGPRLEKGLNGGRSHGNIPEALKAVIQRGVERQTVQNMPSVVLPIGSRCRRRSIQLEGRTLNLAILCNKKLPQYHPKARDNCLTGLLIYASFFTSRTLSYMSCNYRSATGTGRAKSMW